MLVMTEINFPTDLHKRATIVLTEFFLDQLNVDTILLVNSLATGNATPDSDIDVAVLVPARTTATETVRLERVWEEFSHSDPTLIQFRMSSRFAHIHLDIFDGDYKPPAWEDGSPIDAFELEIGNQIRYSMPLAAEGSRSKELKSKWLPYYGDELQSERLELARASCLSELDHVPVFVNRDLHFHAFDRLYVAFQKFLQTLFIKYKTYPIAYNKWIKHQVANILGLPPLYEVLPGIISVHSLTGPAIIQKAAALASIVDEYC
jgi:predicted nucleotidyltransferase